MKTSLDDIEPAVDQHYDQKGLMMMIDADKNKGQADQ